MNKTYNLLGYPKINLYFCREIFDMGKKTYFQYTPPPKTAWDELPMREKTDIMKACVRNGIISPHDIRTAYNNYAAGRNILDGIPDYQANATEFDNFLAGGGKKNSGEKVVVHQPHYAYDSNGRKIDDTLYYNVDVTLPEVVVYGKNKKTDYTEKASQERQRQWEIAKEYLTSTPTIDNITKGLEALVNSSPLTTTSATVNPFMVSGDAPNVGLKGNPLNSTTSNLLKWLGKPLDQKVNISAATYLNNPYNPSYQRMAKMLQDKGVDLSRLNVEDIKKIFDKRLFELRNSGIERFSLARPTGDRHFSVADFVAGRERPVGEMGLEIADDGTALISDITNYTRNGSNPIKGVQERGLNSAINISKSIGGNGVITGREYQSAPKQYHVVQKFKDRKVVANDGIHYNSNMVNDYEGRMRLPSTYDEYIISQDKDVWKGMLELSRAGEKQRKALYGAPVWKLGTTTFETPTKSLLFDPTIINNEGKMIIDWGSPNIFRGFGGKLFTKM